MSLRRQKNPDSLELLLDTMCNTFGGIILIALLIALLSRDASSESGLAQRTERLREELQQVQRQIADAERLRTNLIQQTSDPTATAAIALLTERDQLQQRMEESQRAIQSNITQSASIISTNDPVETERLISERQKLAVEAQRSSEQLQRETQLQQRPLRLPRERNTGKKTFYFIARYGKIFPIHFMRNDRREINTQSLDWRRVAEGEAAEPRAEQGMDAAAGLPALARMFNDIPNRAYSVHFLVYQDSFPIFFLARQIPLQRGYDTGWEFLPADKPVVFSSRGEAPPAL